MGVLLGKFPVHYEAFDEEVASGPVPVFFSERPAESLEALKRSPEYAFTCLQQLVARLVARRELSR